ncbi:MAG: MAPEG family protein, partial [Rhodanobacteraceae bacterium]
MIHHLSVADWCILATALIPLLFTGIAKFGDSDRGFDNRVPRNFQTTLSGWRARAHWAHQNGMEAFPLFAVAALLAEFRAAPQVWVNALALAFIVLRLIYGALYIADRASLRSIVWALGFLCCVGMFVSAV